MIPSSLDILLVEDDPNDAELTLMAFRKYKVSTSIYWVKNGEEAINFLLHPNHPDGRTNPVPRVIMLDIKLPLVNGIEVLKELKSHEETRKIPVVMITSSRMDSDIEKCYDLGANSYVVKPVDLDHFMEAIRHLGAYWLLVNERPKMSA